MPKYAALVRKPSSPFLAREGHAVSELLLSGWAYLCPRGDGSDLSLACASPRQPCPGGRGLPSRWSGSAASEGQVSPLHSGAQWLASPPS